MVENVEPVAMEAGKVGSPKGDVSAKDIVSSIISAANRKMLKAASGKTKKESSVECESERGSSVTRGETIDGVRRESESVIHGQYSHQLSPPTNDCVQELCRLPALCPGSSPTRSRWSEIWR